MKMKFKKVLGILLSVILICTMTPQASMQVKAVDNTVKALFADDGTMYVIYDANSYSPGGTYEGKFITDVYDCDGGNGAMADYDGTPVPWFGNWDNISAVVIGYGVTHIGNYAFSDTAITSVSIANTVTSIGDFAFGRCNSLTSVIIPGTIEQLGTAIFKDCAALEEVVINEGITEIGQQMFSLCRSLTNVIIPNSVRTIDVQAFDGCYSLTSITIPDSVESVGHFAFADSGLRRVEVKGVNTEVSGNAFSGVGIHTYTYEGGNWIQNDQNVTPAELIIPYGFAGGVPDENHNWCSGLFTATIISPVTLNTNGGTINSGNVKSYIEGNEVTLPTDVTRDGYTFGGWYDNSGCTGTAVTTISATATGPQEFWAKWDGEPTPTPPTPPTPIVITYRVNFDPNGGIYNGDNLEIEEGKPFGFSYSDGIIMRKGYLFAGWYTAPVGGERVKSDTIFDGTTTTLYAHWVKVFTGKVWSFEAASYASGRLTVEVQRPVTSVSGYEVSFSLDGKTWYKREQNITWGNAPVSTIYLADILSERYRVRVRAFRYDSAGEKVYGAWSGIKNVNIK